MRQDQSTGQVLYWSAGKQDTINWRGTAERLVGETPTWALVATGGAVLITVLVVGFLTLSRLTKRQAQREQHRREVLALAREQGTPVPSEPLKMDPKPLLGGIAVSLYGLWGFARGTLDLPTFFAIGFVSMFDVLELRLFSLMYKSADPDKGWTPQLRLLQATAWCFVAGSAMANIAHAPNAIAAPFMALMPIGAAWVIELDLRRALAGKESEEKPKQGTKPGPLRLVGLLWRQLWAWGFRKAGLDVNDRADEMVRRARARDAADASYELRKALKEKHRLETTVGTNVPRGRGKVSEERKRLDALERELEKKIRPKAQAALEMADTQDPEQGLQLMQRMAWLTRADDVALLDYGPNSSAMELLEELNIAANADFVKSRKRAAEADRKAADAEEVRLNAEKAVKEAADKLAAVEQVLEETRKAAEEAQEKAEADREAEHKRLQALREERALLENSDATAAQLYQKTAEELDAVKQQMTGLQEERSKLTNAYSTLQQQAQEAQEKALRLEGEQRALEERLGTLTEERNRLTTTASEAQREALEARERVLHLEGQLTSVERLQAAGVPARAPQQPGRVDARIGSDGGDTRQRIRDLLAEMSPEDRRQSQRKLAGQLMDRVGLGLDAVRNHLRAIEKEDKSTGVPGPRTQEDPPEQGEKYPQQGETDVPGQRSADFDEAKAE